MTDRRAAPQRNPHRLPLVQASAPRSVRDSLNRISATLEKPLSREFLLHPVRHISRCCRAVASVLRGSLAYRGSLHRVPAAQSVFRATPTKLFCIQKVVKTKAGGLCKYLLIHKKAVRKSRKTTPPAAVAASAQPFAHRCRSIAACVEEFMLGMVPYHRLKSGHITCYLNRTYHALPTAPAQLFRKIERG
jgi:hypothetical protein